MLIHIDNIIKLKENQNQKESKIRIVNFINWNYYFIELVYIYFIVLKNRSIESYIYFMVKYKTI